MVDKTTIGDEIVNKISNILLNTHQSLNTNDFIDSSVSKTKKELSESKPTLRNSHKKINLEDVATILQKSLSKKEQKEDELGKLAESKEFDGG